MSQTSAVGSRVSTREARLAEPSIAWTAARTGRVRIADVEARLRAVHLLGWDLPELCGRVVIGALFTVLTVRIVASFLQTGRVTGLLLVASEALVVVLTIARRGAAEVDRSWTTRVVAALSIAGAPLLVPVAGLAGPGDLVTTVISAVGLCVVVVAKLSLGRSFGLMPANRGIVSTGLYRAVRHPIYLGYLVTHIGFLLANPTAWNIAVLLCADLALVIRLQLEERTLARDASYRAYRDAVRWRLVPGVF